MQHSLSPRSGLLHVPPAYTRCVRHQLSTTRSSHRFRNTFNCHSSMGTSSLRFMSFLHGSDLSRKGSNVSALKSTVEQHSTIVGSNIRLFLRKSKFIKNVHSCSAPSTELRMMISDCLITNVSPRSQTELSTLTGHTWF